MDVQYSDGTIVKNCVVQIWDDLHTEVRGNWYRAFWCATPVADCGSPVIGYCSPRWESANNQSLCCGSPQVVPGHRDLSQRQASDGLAAHSTAASQKRTRSSDC